MNDLFVLGASDPEMEHIKVLLKSKEARIAYAAVKEADGKIRRVKPNEAYKKDLVAMDSEGKEMDAFVCPYYGKVVTVECALPVIIDDGGCAACCRCECAEWGQPQVTHVVIDHHNPGDPGYGKEPKDYWLGSSLGQVCQWIGYIDNVSPKLKLVAAADHCLAAAYKGECPGVSPDHLLYFRVESRAKFQGRSAFDIQKDVDNAIAYITLDAPLYSIADQPVYVIFDHVAELPEAACRLGIAYIAEVEDKDGKLKVVLGGNTTKSMVERVMELAPTFGITGVYGNPTRGFAGGYLPEGATLRSILGC